MIFGLFVPATRKANVFVVDTVRSNQMPNLVTMYNNERKKITNEEEAESVPEGTDFFSYHLIETRNVCRISFDNI